ncbi:MAG: N-acetylmuramoyl-L-alanine amidase [Parasynechococcus sp.]
MVAAPSRRMAWLLAAVLQCPGLLAAMPAQAASALAAWAMTDQGVLQLRTSRNAQLKAFFQAASAGRGTRVWIDFPGELRFPRRLAGRGAVKEIRIGKPRSGATRLVVEFRSDVDLNPEDLRLRGTAPDRWEMAFVGLPTRGLNDMGEGDLTGRATAWQTSPRFAPSRTPVDPSGLPTVPKNRYRVVIDPGHGGPDPGAVGIRGLRESDVVLDVSLQVAALLRARGVDVRLTRTSEIDVDLPPRVSLANRFGATAFISIHANALSMKRPDVNGIETFYFSDPRSGRLATYLQQQMMDVSPGTPNRGVRRGRFFVIRRTTMPSALVEMGFVTGAIDSPRLARADHRRRLALAIAAGTLNYLKREVR